MGIGIIGVLILILVGFLIEKMVLKRLAKLSSTVNEIHQKKDLSMRIPMDGSRADSDEIGFLVNSMNILFESQERSKQSIHRLLDNAGQGFLSFNASGTINEELSKAAKVMLQNTPAGLQFWDLFEESQKANIQEVLETIFQELLSFEDLSQMLPKAMVTANGKYLEFKYRPVRDNAGKLTHVMVIISHVTELRNLEVKQEHERRLNGALIKILAAPQDFANILDELYTMNQKISSREAFIRSMHTLKGGFALFQCDELAKVCHELETKLKMDSSEEMRKAAFDEIHVKTETFLQNHNNILKINKGDDKTVVLPQQSLKSFMQKAIKLGVPREMLTELDLLLERPAEEVLGWLERVFVSSAEKLNKSVNPIQWKTKDTPINPLGYEGLFRSLVHVVRNAVDHGLESMEERDLAEKDLNGNLEIELKLDADYYHLTFSDDGAGVNISKLRQKLEASGRGGNLTDLQVADSIFESGVTSKDEVSELSGRGVGLDAVRFEARKLGGDVSVASVAGQGTKIKIWFRKLSVAERTLLAA
jgi:two-component system chemotaxis sensor kinase CheA